MGSFSLSLSRQIRGGRPRLAIAILCLALLAFFLSGCGGCDNDCRGGSTKTFHSISFYDDYLDFITTLSAEENPAFDPTTLKTSPTGDWYEANKSASINADLNLSADVRLYPYANVVEIFREEQLLDINQTSASLGYPYILFSDMNLTNLIDIYVSSSEGWYPIADNAFVYFEGIFNGQGHKITNLWIKRPNTDYVGFFGHVEQGVTIRNLTIELDDSKGGIVGKEYTGGVAGYIYDTTLRNVHLIGDVNGSDYVGGIAGYNEASYIYNSSSKGDVNGSENVGGIFGTSVRTSIINSYSASDVNGSDYVGGIAGYVMSGSIENSYSIGNAGAETATAGGIVGMLSIETPGEHAVISKCYATGSVKAPDKVGGLVGDADSNTSVINGAALNYAIDGVTDTNRTVGHKEVSDVNLTNNFVSDAITDYGDSSDQGDNEFGWSKDAATLNYAGAAAANGSGGLGWSFGNGESAPWKWIGGYNYPVLYWQTGAP
ncbi:MAG: hypothetical protein LBI57_00445 [Helicobacteraceae bacterium]|jgi:hypothetical protein|nr:hypothetical protein [Helicobacteraceae bacterium]